MASSSGRRRKNTENARREERDTEGEVHCLVGPRHGSRRAVEGEEREEAGGQGHVDLQDLLIFELTLHFRDEELDYLF